MISLLQNQKILKRISPLGKKSGKYSGKIGLFGRKDSGRKQKGFVKKVAAYPFFIGAAIFFLFIFLSSANIFPISRNGNAKASLGLPQETNLADYDDGSEFVKMLPDERDTRVIGLKRAEYTDNDKPKTYVIKKGDTITSISKMYNISLYDLIRANKITEPRKLRAFDTLVIPARSLSGGSVSMPRGFSKSMRALPEDLSVIASVKSGVSPLGTQFFIASKLDTGALDFLWDLGNDRYSFEENPKNTYIEAGTYNVFVIISDANKNEVVSNRVSVEVIKRSLRRIHIDSTLPRYFTFNQVNDLVELRALVPKNGSAGTEMGVTVTQHPVIFKDAGDNRLVSVEAGYSELTVQGKGASFYVHVFVSPIPSKHSFEPEYDWYKTQFATGINGNCGPAVVAMAIRWAKGDDVPVAKVRHEIGLPYANGAIDYSHMDKSFEKHGVSVKQAQMRGIEDIRRVVDKGNIAIVVFNTRSIARSRGTVSSNFTGRYYDDITGHYVIVKGYTLDGKYAIVYDPMPSDWVSNGARYADGRTMLGKNRYYPVSQLVSSMGREAYEISR